MKRLLIILLLISTTLVAKDYALIVAISKYQSSEIPRLNTKKDIQHYENILKKMNFKGSQWHLNDEEATKFNILKDIKNISQVIKKDDRFFMFFTGHGTDYQDGDFGSKIQETLPEKYFLNTGMLLPYDFNPKKSGIADSIIIGKRDLRKYFTAIDNKTDRAFIVFDACFPENSSKGEPKSNITRFLYIDTYNKTYPYKNIVYIGASKTQARSGKLSKVLDGCISSDVSFIGLKSCMNESLKKSPHKAIVLSNSSEPMIFGNKGYLALK